MSNLTISKNANECFIGVFSIIPSALYCILSMLKAILTIAIQLIRLPILSISYGFYKLNKKIDSSLENGSFFNNLFKFIPSILKVFFYSCAKIFDFAHQILCFPLDFLIDSTKILSSKWAEKMMIVKMPDNNDDVDF